MGLLATQMKNGISKEYNTFDTLHSGFKSKYSQQEFFDAWTILQAKAYDVEYILPGFNQRVLAPFIDQINFSVLGNVEWKYEKREDSKVGYFIKATRPIKRGEELVTQYPEQNNRQLFQSYGFVDPENEITSHVFMGLTLGANDPLKPYKDFWFKQGDPQAGGAISIMPDGNFDSVLGKDALAILRVAFFDDAQSFQYLMNANISWDRPRKNNFRPWSLKIEAQIMKFLQSQCMQKLR